LLLVGTFSLLTLADPAFTRDSVRAYRWVIVEPVLFYFLLTDIIATRRGLWRMADFFVAAAVAVAFVGLAQFALRSDTLVVEEVSRVQGVYQHPNNLALYLGRVLPFVICVGLFLPRGPRKWLYLAAAVPLAVTTLLTYSRGAYVAVALSVALAAAVGLVWGPGIKDAREARNRMVLVASGASILLGLLLIITAALLPLLPTRFTTIGSGVLRVELWISSLQMLRDHPIFGVGPDQFLNQFQAHYMAKAQEAEAFTAHPHNLLLDYWLTLGIMGVPILLWLLWRYFREALLKAKNVAMGRDGDLAGRAVALGLLASMLDFLLHGLVDNSYFLMDLAMIFWLCCGLLQLTRMRNA
jgi:O-antigen ligase